MGESLPLRVPNIVRHFSSLNLNIAQRAAACHNAAMSSRASPSDPNLPVLPEQVIGGKYVRILQKELNQLRAENPHGNQTLFLDDVFITYLLAFHNPTLRSLRTIEDFSQTKQAQKHLSIPKICKSTLSDFNQLCQPERLQPILTALRRELSRKTALQSSSGHPEELQVLLDKTYAVDGTFIPALADVCWAVANSNQHRKALSYRARLDARVHVTSWIPETIVVPEPQQSEADCAIEHLQPGRLYLYDRGYQSFDLVRAHFQTEPQEPPIAHFVMRFKPGGINSPKLYAPESRELTDKDRAAGVVSDHSGTFHSTTARRAGLRDCPVREVVVEFQEDDKTVRLRLITNLLDVPAYVIGLLYRQRWQVELFFRWFKSIANFNHLISHSPQGLLTQLYTTIIGVMLMYLHTGYRPSKYLFSLLSNGADLEDILPILRERERRCALARESQRRREAKKRAAQ